MANIERAVELFTLGGVELRLLLTERDEPVHGPLFETVL